MELAGPLLAANPMAVPDLAAAVGLIDDGVEVLVAGDRADLVDEVHHRWLPTTVLAWGERTPSPFVGGTRDDGMAYLCRGFSCRAPTGDRHARWRAAGRAGGGCARAGLTGERRGTSFGRQTPNELRGGTAGAVEGVGQAGSGAVTGGSELRLLVLATSQDDSICR